MRKAVPLLQAMVTRYAAAGLGRVDAGVRKWVFDTADRAAASSVMVRGDDWGLLPHQLDRQRDRPQGRNGGVR